MRELEVNSCANLWQQTFHQSFSVSGEAALAIENANKAVDAFQAKIFTNCEQQYRAPNQFKAVP